MNLHDYLTPSEIDEARDDEAHDLPTARELADEERSERAERALDALVAGYRPYLLQDPPTGLVDRALSWD